ncbi:hypothetical protein CFE70_000325 [Pyrenophora teres f. teres 0-1]
MELDSFVLSKLMTNFSSNSKDNQGKTAWSYFCTKTIPTVAKDEGSWDYPLRIIKAFLQEGALGIKESDYESSVDLLVDMCLKHVDFISRDYPERNNHPKLIAWFLVDALELLVADAISSSPQTVRLLSWSLYKPVPYLSQKLLELGVDVHATSDHYGGTPAISDACNYRVDIDMFMSILKHTTLDRINEAFARGDLVHFGLFSSYNSNFKYPERIECTASKLEAFLNIGVDPNIQCNWGRTAAMKAAETGFIQGLRLLTNTTKWLIDNGADVNLKCGVQQTSALHIALRLGRLENAVLLVKAGAEFSKDSNGVSPEMQVDQEIRAEFLTFLNHTEVSIPVAVFEEFKRDYRVQSNDDLYDAIVNGDLQACRSFIHSTSQLPKNLGGCGECTPLMIAIANERRDIAELLLKHGATASGTPCSQIQGDMPCRNTLEMAIERPQFNDLLDQLLERWLEHESHWSQDGGIWRPLQIAAGTNLNALKALVNHLRKHYSLFRSVDRKGRSSLHLAASDGKMNAFRYLISHGWNPYKLDKDGCSPICRALTHPHLAAYVYANCLDLTHLIPESVVQQGLRLDDRKQISRFIYELLSKDSSPECIHQLFAKGTTPLISSAQQGDLEGVQKSIKAGFMLEIRDKDGHTALMAACIADCTSSVAFLVRQGAELEYTLENRRISAYQLAEGNQDVIKWLLVKRWTDQGRLTESAFNSNERIRPWAGVRTVEIPLQGKFAQPEGEEDANLQEHLKIIAEHGWRVMVPLGWDTIAHLTVLPTDL